MTRDKQLHIKKRNMLLISQVLLIGIFLSFIMQLIFNLGGLAYRYSTNFCLFINTYICFVLIIAYIFSRGINKHFILFGFYMCFFILVMGQRFIYTLKGGHYNYFPKFGDLYLTGSEYFAHINIIYFSLLGIYLGYCAFKKIRSQRGGRVLTKKSDISMPSIRNLLRILFVTTIICPLIMNIQILSVKTHMSYTDGYLIDININPFIKIGNYIFSATAFLFLACKPTKKEMLVILLAYLSINCVLPLFIGQRMLFAKTALFAVWYCICYFKLNKKKFRLKNLFQVLLFGIILVFIFEIVEIMRDGNSVRKFSMMEFFESFFISMGGSDSVIANTIHYGYKFPEKGIVYFFYPIKNALTNNIIVNLLFGNANSANGQSLLYLSQHNSFAHWISYLVCPELYFKGHGMGSSYIAETYLAFGAVGVAIVSFVIGVFIGYLSKFDIDSDKIYKKALIMYLVSCIFVWPRDSMFSAATDFLYFFLSLLIIKILSYMLIIHTHKKQPQTVKRNQ